VTEWRTLFLASIHDQRQSQTIASILFNLTASPLFSVRGGVPRDTMASNPSKPMGVTPNSEPISGSGGNSKSSAAFQEDPNQPKTGNEGRQTPIEAQAQIIAALLSGQFPNDFEIAY
jgi:hypothetical protein